MNNLIETLSELEKQQIKIVEYSKNQTIFFEGEECQNIGIVIAGKIKISSFLENGQEMIYKIVQKNDMFGNNLILSSEPKYRGDVIALEDTKIYLLNKEQLISFLNQNTKFLISYINDLSNFGKELNLKIKLLTINDAKERLLYFMQINNNQIKYKTITDLAKIIYLTRESLSRTMHDLERKQIIKIKDKTITKI